MKRWFTSTAALGAVASLLGSAIAVPAVALAQEEEGERGDREERRVRIVEDTPRGVLMATRAGGYLGIRTAEVDEEDVARLGLPEERGALVVEVVDETPAAEAGLEADDVIASWNGEPVESATALSRLVRETPAGRTVRLGVIRDGSERQVTVELGEPSARFRSARLSRVPTVRMGPGDRMRVGRGPDRAGILRMYAARPRLGVSVTGMTDQLAEYFGAEDGGALITRVSPETPAARAGLRAGDVILSVAGEEVDGPGDITRILADREEGPVEVRFLRERQERTVTVELEAPEAGSGSAGAFFVAPGIEMALPELHLELHPLPPPHAPAGELHVAPLAPLPPFEWPHIEIEVDGIQEVLGAQDWGDYARSWEEWADRWAERADEWGERARRWEAEWKERAEDREAAWKERAEDWEARWKEWAERWQEWSDGWSEAWREHLREWRESRPFEVIEVSDRSAPVFL